LADTRTDIEILNRFICW